MEDSQWWDGAAYDMSRAKWYRLGKPSALAECETSPSPITNGEASGFLSEESDSVCCGEYNYLKVIYNL